MRTVDRNRGASSATDDSRRHTRAALRELLGLVIGPLPWLPSPSVLRDCSADPGLFGPASATWRLAREPVLLLGGSRALLLQVAHPLVGQAVVAHSAFATHPYGRLVATVRWLVVVTFGTTAEATAAIRDLRRVHERVTGTLTLENATDRLPAGTRYAANDPTLARWVLATIVESLLVSYEALVGPLSVGAQNRVVRESQAVGERMGIDRSALWSDAPALRAYVAGQVACGSVRVVPASAQAARVVLRPPLPWPGLDRLSGVLSFMTAGLLPAAVRRGYGIRWTRRHERLHGLVCGAVRATHPVLPRRLRISRPYEIATGRLAGGGRLSEEAQTRDGLRR
jgi:uncharacterized protein (DUF2236 family)